MLTLPSLSLFRKRNSSSKVDKSVNLPRITEYDIENSTSTVLRSLKHILKLNHANYSLLNDSEKGINQCASLLSSAMVLGFAPKEMEVLSENIRGSLKPWDKSPAEVTRDDWTEFIGRREYERAFLDFFEDEMVEYGYDWHRLVNDYLLEGTMPLINRLVFDSSQALVHLGHAMILTSRELATEALVLASITQDPLQMLHQYADQQPHSARHSGQSHSSVLDILDRVASDVRLSNILNIDDLLQHHKAELMEYWAAWDITTSPVLALQTSQRVATALVLIRFQSKKEPNLNRSVMHTLNMLQAIRLLASHLPGSVYLSLVRQWCLRFLVCYITQGRPHVSESIVDQHSLQGRDWDYVRHQARTGLYSCDVQYLQTLRTMKEMADTWPDDSLFYLKAAVLLASSIT